MVFFVLIFVIMFDSLIFKAIQLAAYTVLTGVPMVAWKCNFPPFWDIKTARLTNGRTDQVIGKLHFQQAYLIS